MTIRFYKEEDDDGRRWYADLEGFTKADLEMVHHADAMLDIITAMQTDQVVLEITETPRETPWKLVLTHAADQEAEGGGYYTCYFNEHILLRDVWLCEVTRAFFGHIPDQFYISTVYTT